MNPDLANAEFARPRRRWWNALACAAIVAAGIAAYSNTFNNPFLFDDAPCIENNLTIRHFPAWENFVPPQAKPTARRPISNLTFALNYAIGGLEARGFHAGNLLIHLLAALALFGIVRRTLLTPPLREKFGRAACGLATVVALIWVVHPLQTESVTYLTQRMESQMGLFYLLTLYCAIRGAPSTADAGTRRRDAETRGRGDAGTGRPDAETLRRGDAGNAMADTGTRRRGDAEKRLPLTLRVSPSPRLRVFLWQAAAIAACVLGVGSKEVMVSAPVVVLVYDRCFLFGSFREAFRRRGGFYLGLAAIWAILGALLIAYPMGGASGAGFSRATHTRWEYARTQPEVVLHYLRLCFWPNPLCLDYGWPVATSAWRIAPAAAAIAALLAATFWALRRAPAIGFLGAWFFLVLQLTSSVMPIPDIAFEHRMYLPLAAVVAGAVIVGFRCWDRAWPPASGRWSGAAFAGAAVLAVAALGVLTVRRNADYHDVLALWKQTVRRAPGNARAYFNLSCALLEQQERSKDTSPAVTVARLAALDQAIALNPRYADAYCNRGNMRCDAGHYAEAIRDYDQAIAFRPNGAEAWCNRGVTYAMSGRPAKALTDLNKAIALKPDYGEAYRNRALLYYNLKDCVHALEDVREAQRLGMPLKPSFVRSVTEGAGRSKTPLPPAP